MTTLVHDLLDLPEAVRKGDFVQGLTDGIASPVASRRDYLISQEGARSVECSPGLEARPARYVATGDDA
jgi:hypothetical protein